MPRGQRNTADLTDPVSSLTSPRSPRRARVAVTAAFVTQGLLFASWAAHIPILKARLGLNDAELGTALLGAPAGSVVGLAIAGWLLPRAGSRLMVQVVRRLGSPLLVQRVDTRILLPALGVIATLGMTTALVTGSFVTGIIGFGTLGLGVALIVPTCFGVAGRMRGLATGRVVAIVSGMGWFGFMTGPPLIGHLAGASTLAIALGVVPILLLFSSVAILRARIFDPAGP